MESRRAKPRSVSAAQRAAQGGLLLGGGLLVGVGVVIGSIITWRIRAENAPPPPLEAADPPVGRKRTEPNYELLRSPIVASIRARTSTSGATVIAELTAAAAAEPTRDVPEPREEKKRRRKGKSRRTEPIQERRITTEQAASPKPPEEAPEEAPKPPPNPAEKAEAMRLLAASDAIKRAPDAELRARVKDLAETPLTVELIVTARDRCAAVYTNLLDGLERLERTMERAARATSEDEEKLRVELEKADAAAEAAKRGVLACEAGLAKLRVTYR